MTISSTTRKAGPFTGNGVTTVFPFSFKVFSSADLYVVRADTTGVETELALTTDFSVSLNADQNSNPGGSITLTSALPSGYALTITSALDYLQATVFSNLGGFYPAVLNDALDRLTIFCQQLAEEMSRAAKIPLTLSGVPTIPAPGAGKFLRWNLAGTDLEAVSGTGTVPGDFLQSGTGAVARTNQSKMGDIVSVKDFGAAGDGIADDTAAITAAVARVLLINGMLLWPDGTYLTSSSIPSLHSVRHIGPGTIKRGSDLFHVDISNGQSNTLYVATTGSAGDDGLSASQPISTMQIVFDALKNYGPVLFGSWTIKLAAGTYNAAAQLVGLRSSNSIVVRGPSVGGSPNVPTAIIDGTGVVSNTVGWYLQFYVKMDVYDVKFQNWTSAADDAYGLCGDGHCQIYLNNAHAYNCRYAGFSFDNLTQARMLGGVVDSCLFTGVRLYSQVSASIGYTGSVAGDSTEIKNCGTAIDARVSSRLHVDYCNIHNNDIGVHAEYNSRAVVNYSKVQNNNIGWTATLGAEIHTSYDGSNIISGNSKDFICYSSILSATTANECNYSDYWDETTKRRLYGAAAYRTPNAKFEWQLDSAASNSAYNSGVKCIFDFNSATNYLGLSGPATAFTGICWTAPAKSAQAIIGYNFNNDYMDFWQGAAQQYRMQATQFVPLTDNDKGLGNGSFRWATANFGSSPTITSDGRDKQDVVDLSAAEKRVARTLKSSFRRYRMVSSVQKKGGAARKHFGIQAQDVKAAFEAEGLVAEEYGVFCRDDAPDHPDGYILGVRYDELFAFLMAAS